MKCGHNHVIILDLTSEDPSTPVVKCGVCGAIYTNAEVNAEKEAENSLERRASKAVVRLQQLASDLHNLGDAACVWKMDEQGILFFRMAGEARECSSILAECCEVYKKRVHND